MNNVSKTSDTISKSDARDIALKAIARVRLSYPDSGSVAALRTAEIEIKTAFK